MSAIEGPCKRGADEGTPYVTINGQKIDARDQHAIDEAFKKVASLRDQVVASYSKHLNATEIHL